MFTALTAWIPVIGPIINGITSIYSKSQDTKVIQIKEDSANRQLEVKTSYSILELFRDDIGLKIARDIIVWPVAIWTALVSWDTIVAESILSDWMWHVASFDKTSVPYLPYAVLVFLLGNIGINTWNKR